MITFYMGKKTQPDQQKILIDNQYQHVLKCDSRTLTDFAVFGVSILVYHTYHLVYVDALIYSVRVTSLWSF